MNKPCRVYTYSSEEIKREAERPRRHPGPMTNEDILDPEEYYKTKDEDDIYNVGLKSNLKCHHDYKVITQKQWEYLYGIYGGVAIIRGVKKSDTSDVMVPDLDLKRLSIIVLPPRDKLEIDDILKEKNILVNLTWRYKEIKERIIKVLNQNGYTLTKDNFRLWGTETPTTTKELIKLLNENMEDLKHKHNENKNPDIEENSGTQFPGIPLNLYKEIKNTTIVIEQADNRGIFMFKYNKNLKIAVCYGCYEKKPLLCPCNCGKIAYCSTHCLKRYKTYHEDDCTFFDSSMYKMTSESNKGLIGLRNLGNTCYMNSGVQCLSNTLLLTKFFLEDLYQEDINESNPLGTKGALARSYAKLIKMLWCTAYDEISLEFFKKVIGDFRPMFSNNNQHDAQELVSAILDGLHEDLNRVKNKPYVEVKSTDDPNNDAISIDSWYCHLARNQSIIVDLMYGQYKSILECPKCNKYSVTFDPFSMISLPIASKKEKVVKFYYVPYDTGKKIQKHALVLKRDSTIEDMRVLVASKLGVHKDGSTFTMINKRGKDFNHFLNKDKKISEITENKQAELYIQEINPKYFIGCENERVKEEKFGCEEIKEVKSDSPYNLQYYEEQKLEIKDHDDNNNGLSHDLLRVSLDILKLSWSCNNYEGPSKEKSTFNRLIYIRRSHTMRQVHMEIFNYFRPFIEKPSELYMKCENDNIINEEDKNHFIFNNKGCKEELKEDKNYSLVSDEELFEKLFPNLNENNWENASTKNYPYVLKLKRIADRNNNTGFPYHRKEAYNNCLVPFRSDLTVQDLFNRINDPDAKNDYSHQTGKSNLSKRKELEFEVIFGNNDKINMKHLGEVEESEDYNHLAKEQHIAIYNCFEQFSAREKLSENDLWYCPTCKDHVQAFKRIEIFRAPPILILHLKRFKITGSILSFHQISERLDSLVSYPLENLNLREFVREKNVEPIYDLYAVSNHFGSLGSGHYTAYVRNNNCWWSFDDSSVKKMSPSDVCSTGSYVLFYKRKDLKDDMDLELLRQTVPSDYKVNIIELKTKSKEDVKANGVSPDNSSKGGGTSTSKEEDKEISREISVKECEKENRRKRRYEGDCDMEQQCGKSYFPINSKNLRG